MAQIISINELAGFGKIQALSNTPVVAIDKNSNITYINSIGENWLAIEKNGPLNEGKLDLKQLFDSDNYYKWENFSIDFENEVWAVYIGRGLTSDLNFNNRNNLNNIIENFPELVYWKDSNLRYQGCNKNAAGILGYKSSSDIIGKSDIDLAKEFNWSEDRVKNLRDTDMEIIKDGINTVEEDPIPGHDDTRIYLTSKKPLYNNGEIVGILGISTDITDRKKMEEDLNKAKIAAEAGEKAKSEFIANVSHDMRTPLSGIISIAHELEENDITEGTRRELSVQLAEAADALLEMFEEILEDVAAEHMTESDITLETFDINRLVDRLVKLEKPSLTQKGLKFLTNIAPNIPQYLVSDRRKIHRIVLNLIGNAVKFTKQGHIELKIELIEKQNDQIQVTLKFNVIDTGIGVPETSKKRLFERFYKASPSYQTEYKGFGLGLHIAKTYTHLLGGTISFESTEGIGSDFYAIITLKVANEEEIAAYNKITSQKHSSLKINTNSQSTPSNENLIEKTASIPKKNTEISSLPGAPHVLIIEDNLVLRRTTARLVKKYQLNVMDVEDGKPALELAKTQHFDLILSDVGLIEMSGIEFTQKLRAFEKENNMPPVPIVGVTAHAANGSDECLSAGMNAVVPKPLTPELLKEILQKFLPLYKRIN